MTSNKHRLHSTQTDNLFANLRGEVGEVILSWILLRYVKILARPLWTDDPTVISEDPNLFLLDAIAEKLEDEIAARLSELAQPKIGTLNFHFVQKKISKLHDEVADYTEFIKRSRIKERRDNYVSHKNLPETWQEHRYLLIPYPTLVEGVAKALRLMKKFDYEYLGPKSTKLWREMRKKRYDFTMPPRTGYMLLPYLRLSREDMMDLQQEQDTDE